MKSTLSRRLRVESLESRTLLAACPVDGGLALDLAEPLDQAPPLVADQVAGLPPGLTDGQLPAGVEAATAHARQVERPFNIRGNTTAVVNLLDGSFEAEGGGIATHLGKYSMAGWGVMNPETGDGAGGGVTTAANGDQLHWDYTSLGTTLTFTFKGGTGRFQHATGGLTFVAEVVSADVDPVAGTLTLTYSFAGTGSIKY